MSDAATGYSFGTMAEESKKNAWTPLKENLYLLEVHDVKNEFRPSYRDPNVEEDTLIVTFKVLKGVDGTDVEDINGEYPASNLLSAWLNLAMVGFNKKTNQAHKTRQVLTALMGVPVESAIEIKSFDELIGKKCKAYVELTTRPDGSQGNKLSKFSKA